MSAVEIVLAVPTSITAVLTIAGTVGRWIDKRRDKAAQRAASQAEDKARLERVERQATEIQKQVEAIRKSQEGDG